MTGNTAVVQARIGNAVGVEIPRVGPYAVVGNISRTAPCVGGGVDRRDTRGIVETPVVWRIAGSSRGRVSGRTNGRIAGGITRVGC